VGVTEVTGAAGASAAAGTGGGAPGRALRGGRHLFGNATLSGDRPHILFGELVIDSKTRRFAP
ncbi:hypothetical protein, partial [Streptomyces lonarensis]|uniref:hypothetical protein n=1 Tax=Streptomyces lonarensis TaxID=700599 RepID=UPI0030C77F33